MILPNRDCKRSVLQDFCPRNSQALSKNIVVQAIVSCGLHSCDERTKRRRLKDDRPRHGVFTYFVDTAPAGERDRNLLTANIAVRLRRAFHFRQFLTKLIKMRIFILELFAHPDLRNHRIPGINREKMPPVFSVAKQDRPRNPELCRIINAQDPSPPE
jgi:hypothetical protein